MRGGSFSSCCQRGNTHSVLVTHLQSSLLEDFVFFLKFMKQERILHHSSVRKIPKTKIEKQKNPKKQKNKLEWHRPSLNACVCVNSVEYYTHAPACHPCLDQDLGHSSLCDICPGVALGCCGCFLVALDETDLPVKACSSWMGQIQSLKKIGLKCAWYGPDSSCRSS